MQSMTIDSAAIRLTETILGDDGPDLEQTLKAIATNIGVHHIAYAPLCSQKSEDANLFRGCCHGNLALAERSQWGSARVQAAVAACQFWNASPLRARSVLRETRWR
jgi:hypothetical protein